MHMLRFQDALAEAQWQEALLLCSERVRNAAGAWSSVSNFFVETMPVEHVLAQSFGCWSCSSNFYGLVLSLSAPGTSPPTQWFWGIERTAGGWAVDYPPVKLDEYVTRKKRAIQERDDRLAAIQRDLAPKASGVQARLTALNSRFTLGSPMIFRLELTNSGATAVHFVDSGVRHNGLSISTAGGVTIPYHAPPVQMPIRRGELRAGSSVVIADSIDLNAHGAITKPGKYVVRFVSGDLRIGTPIPHQSPGRFGENELIVGFDFISATNNFPSNAIEIEVHP